MLKVLNIVLLCFLCVCSFAQEREIISFSQAIEANNKGFEFYERQDYKQAETYFRLSILFDASYILPHYNLACVLNLLRNQGEDITIAEIIAELVITLNLDPSKAQRNNNWLPSRLREDSDLFSLHEEEAYQYLFQYEMPTGWENPETWFSGSTWIHKYGSNAQIYHAFGHGHEYFERYGHGDYFISGNWTYPQDNRSFLIAIRLENLNDTRSGKVEHLPPMTLFFYPYEMKISMPSRLGKTYYDLLLAANSFNDHVNYGNYGPVIQLLQNKFPINYYNDDYGDMYDSYDSYYPLLTAFRRNDICMMQLLIGYGIEIYPETNEKIAETYPELYNLILMKNDILKTAYSNSK